MLLNSDIKKLIFSYLYNFNDKKRYWFYFYDKDALRKSKLMINNRQARKKTAYNKLIKY